MNQKYTFAFLVFLDNKLPFSPEILSDLAVFSLSFTQHSSFEFLFDEISFFVSFLFSQAKMCGISGVLLM